MVQSMTAFARSQKTLDIGHLSWEIRSINHRFFDVSFHLPEAFRFLEASLRPSIRNKLSRGKIDCQLKYQDSYAENPSLHFNAGMINALIDLSDKLSTSHHLPNDLAISQVLTWPGVLKQSHLDIDRLSGEIIALFNESVTQLIEARLLEGQGLKLNIDSRLKHLAREVKHLQALVGLTANNTKDKLLTRLQALELEVTGERLSQEIAILLTRLDISEELDRLNIHIGEITRILNEDKIIGRRLDFLMQELNREANTLSSKSDTIEVSQSAVEMKVLIEQMREQVQNIE